MASSETPDHIQTIIHNISDHTLKLQDRPAPVASPSQYLIEVRSSTFTAGELEWPEPNTLKEPIPGFDLAGIVVSAPSDEPPEGTTYFTPGTRVYGLTSFSRHGNARTMTVAEHSELSQIPDGIEFNTAASIPLSALTAWQLLFDHAALEPAAGANHGKRVLITAASGGVGIWLVQLASWAGAYVIGSCSSRNAEFVKSLGASEVLDYSTTNLAQWAKSDASLLCDVVVDGVGGKTLEEAWTVAKEGGYITSIALPADIKKPAEGVKPNVRSVWFIVEPNGDQLRKLAALIQQHKIRPQIDSTWELKEYQKAWQNVSAGHVSGKIVLEVHA